VTPGGPTRVIAASLGLSAFAIAIVAGLAAENPAETILARAVVSMVVCHVVGWCVGLTAERAVMDAVDAYERERSNAVHGPVPAAGAEVKVVDSVVSV
jgi:tetrahydromethanopterin S-methyltransferase subunit C